jgi:hypothetical protein
MKDAMPAPAHRSPTVEQWRAIRQALERVVAQGMFRFAFPLVRELPKVTIEWDSNWLPGDAQGACRFNDDGTATIAFRTDASPRSLIVTALHEFRHAGQFRDVLNGTPRSWLEHEAYDTQRYLREILEIDPSL